MIIKVFFDSLQKKFRRLTRKRKRPQRPICTERFGKRLRASAMAREAMVPVPAE